MTEQEIVNAWKENERYFASPNITDEMREWARKHYADMQYLDLIIKWGNKGASEFSDYNIYRLRPDFELKKEAEIIELAVYDNNIHLVFECGESGTYRYNDAITITKFNDDKVVFAGYKYASGIVRNDPLVQSKSRDMDTTKPLYITFPVSVLLRKVSK